MNSKAKAYLVGGGIGNLAAAAFLIRDGGMPGANISIFESLALMGGSLDAAGTGQHGYSMRGGRMLTTDNYECTWNLFKSIPSLDSPGMTVYNETVEFNRHHLSNSMARLVDKRRAKVPVESMGFSMQDRIELLKLTESSEEKLGPSRITDWLSPEFFATNFWYMWSTTFAFQPWHSAVEFKRYLHRFMLKFSRIETLAGVKRTIYNQYDSLVLPLQSGLSAQGVQFINNTTVTTFDHKLEDGKLQVTGIRFAGNMDGIAVAADDFVFFQNGSMTDASSLGSMTTAPAPLTKAESGGWKLWEEVAQGRPEFGNPAAFNSSIAQSCWESFTVTLSNGFLRQDD
jgi:oleate hydratase